MATVFLYYRKESNNSDYDSVADPTDIVTTFPLQVLEFDTADDLLETVDMHYENNVKDSPISNPDGSRTIAKQDNGTLGITWTFRGRFKDGASDIVKLINFAIEPQVEATTATNALSHGKFGFFTDNTVLQPFNLDPKVSGAWKQGMTIRSFDIHRSGQVPKNFDFTIVTTFGGNFLGNV